MALRITLHELAAVTDQNGRILPILGKQITGEVLAVGAAVASSAAAPESCLVHFKAGEDCYIAIGEEDAAAADIATSFPLDAGGRDTRYLAIGEFISVIAA